jgi:competence protein ComEC
MTHWIPYALVRVVVFFMGGIIVGLFFPNVIPSGYGPGLLAGVAASYIALFYFHRRLQRRIFNPGVFALSAVFIAGYFNVINNLDDRRTDHISTVDDSIEWYEAVLVDIPHEKEKSWKQTATVIKVRSNGKWRGVNGNILLYFSRSAFPEPFQYGDHLLISGMFTRIPAPQNPGEFDYRKFMSYKRVYHQHFLRDNKVRLLRNDPPSRIMTGAFFMRDVADKKLKSLVEGDREKALASALVLGVVDGLDNDLMDAYAATGAMHVLAVSGLHVGILYWILLILLKPLKPFRWGRWVITFSCLIVLWGYACVTGLSPSVLRAVVMFSFVVVAYPLNYRTNIYNILAASAFCLLLYDPFMIVSVGFQLSYLAVLGIVYLQPLLYNLIEPQNRILDETWKITCVSLAAQLSTFMLGLLYFHQFPNYFLISNLFVIPLSFVILMVGLIALSLSFIAALGSALGYCLTFLIKVLNYLVFWVESWPYSLIENIFISSWQALILGAVVLLLCFYLESRKPGYLAFASVTLILFALCNWQHFTSEVSGKRLIVYRVPNQTVYDLSDNGVALAFATLDSTSDPRRLDFHLGPNRLAHGILEIRNAKEMGLTRPVTGGSITVWRGITILQISEMDFRVPPGLNVDYAILSKNAIRSLKNLLSKCNPTCVIVDSSNSRSVAAEIVDEARENSVIKVHSVWHHGAFEVKL